MAASGALDKAGDTPGAATSDVHALNSSALAQDGGGGAWGGGGGGCGGGVTPLPQTEEGCRSPAEVPAFSARGRAAGEDDERTLSERASERTRSERTLSDVYSPGLRSSWDICDKEFGQVSLGALVLRVALWWLAARA